MVGLPSSQPPAITAQPAKPSARSTTEAVMTRSDSWQASRRLAALEAAASEVQDPWGRALRLA